MSEHRGMSRVFLYLHLVFLLPGGLLLLLTEKGDIVVWVNDHHTYWVDLTMKYITFLGDGLMLIPLLVVALFVSYRRALHIVLTSPFILLFSQGFKKTIFAGWPRPTAYLEGVEWNKVEGVAVATMNTFPSGHTIAGFAIFFFLAWLVHSRSLAIACWIAAVLVGFSRIYLLQHFYVDVLAGSLLGILTVYLGQLLLSVIWKGDTYRKLGERSLKDDLF